MTAGQLLSQEITPDKADAPCAACSVQPCMGTRRHIQGVLIMLCNNAGNCASRYRQGLTPEQYAKRLNHPGQTS